MKNKKTKARIVLALLIICIDIGLSATCPLGFLWGLLIVNSFIAIASIVAGILLWVGNILFDIEDECGV